MAACTAVAISISASAGDDPVPLFEAGSNKMHCVIGLQALGQIDIQHAVFTTTATGPSTAASYGQITINDPITKNTFSGQSGTPYYIAGTTFVGKTS